VTASAGTPSGRSVLILAGEPSGDHHAAALATELGARFPDVRLVGTGGARMADAGVDLLAGLDDLSVMGFVEVLPRIPFFRRLTRRLHRLMDEERPDLVILVDYPGFNLRMARAAHDRGIPVLYYIAPQVWAWKQRRARLMAEITDRVAVILPFETEFLGRFGVDATYVGHPLIDRPDDVVGRVEFLTRHGLDDGRPILAMLPGSREQELARHLEPFRAIAERVVAHRPDVLPVFSRAASLHAGPFHELGFPVVDDTRALQRHAQAALVKSGTSTLETAIEGTPFAIGYRTSAITAALARRLVKTEHIGLPNLIAGDRVVPEFFQEELNPDMVAPVLLELLDEQSATRAAQVEGLRTVRKRLGDAGAATRVADLVSELLGVDDGAGSEP
jgi:lipid-A-disaccharide synthase